MGDIVFAAVNDGSFVVPRAKDGTYCTAELFAWILRKIFSGALADQFTETVGEGAESGGIELGVGNVRVIWEQFLFEIFDNDLKRFVFFAGAFLHPHHDIPVHLQKPAVAVIGEAFIAAEFRQGSDGAVIQSEIEDGVHHPGHRVAGAGTNGDKERIRGVPEFLSHGCFQLVNRLVDLFFEGGGVGPVMVVEISTDFGADRESRRDRETDPGHFCQIGSLASKKGLHLPVAVRFSVPEGIDVFYGFRGGFFRFGALGFGRHK